MMTCSIRDPLAEAQAEIAKCLSDWVAAGQPRPLDFMIHFAGRSAALLRQAGQSDEWIRAAIVPVLEATIETYPPSVRATFLDAVDRKLGESLPPLSAQARKASPIKGPMLDADQRAYEEWLESADPAATAPLMAMVESLKGLACTLRSIGRRDGSIRAQVEEIVRTNCVAMRPQDHAFIVGRVRNALDEVLGEIA